MKRRAHQHASGSPHGTGLQQLEGLPLRLIALKLSDPGPLALSCTATHRSITSGGDFDDEWFLRWVHALVPLRPWQYAAVGWRRLGGQHATAEQLCAFILRISAAKQQKLDALRAQHASTALPAATAAAQGSPEHPDTPAQQMQPGPAQQQQQQPNPAQEDAGASDGIAKPSPLRPKFGPMPHLAPIPSVLRQARKLLAKGDPVRALAVLCPGYAWVLYQYAAAAGNVQLLEQLISTCYQTRGVGFYPSHGMSVSGGGCRMVSSAQAAAYAAMRAGHTSVLTMLLLSAGPNIRSRPHQLGQLFRFAVRHSNAACVQQLLAFAPCTDINGFTKLTPWPQHLAMAAGRVDPWAGEVVSLLLRLMNRKLLAAKYMGPVYGAACRTGHTPVLQQLLQQLVERSPAAHWPVLLRAAAVAGNRSIWQQLLGQREDQQQDPQEPPADRGAAVAVLLGARTAASIPAAVQAPAAGTSSAGGGLLSYLSRWFTSQPTLQQQPQQHQQQQESQAHQPPQQEQQGLWQLPQLPRHCLGIDSCWPVLLAILDGACVLQRYAGQEGLGLTADSDRLAMADTFWHVLGQQGWQDTVRTAAQQQLCADVAPWASFGGVQQLLAKAPNNKLVWMLQYDMLPQLPDGWLVAPAAAEGLKRRIQLCMKYAQRQAAAVLWQLAKRLRVQVPVRALVLGCLDGEVHRAAAAHRIEDLQQQALLFAEYHASISGGEVISQHRLSRVLHAESSPQQRLLTVLSCVWNTAVGIYTRGLPRQLGIPWQQHLRLCASAVLPSLLQALLPSVPTSTIVQMFEFAGPKLVTNDGGFDSMAQVMVQLRQLLQLPRQDESQSAATADLAADAGPTMAKLLKCSLQLSWLCMMWQVEGVKGLVFPMGEELAYLPMGSAAVPGMLLGIEGGLHLFSHQFIKDMLCDLRAVPVPMAVMDRVVTAVLSLEADNAAAATAGVDTAAEAEAAAAEADTANAAAAPAGQQDAAQSGEASTAGAEGAFKAAVADEGRPAAAAAAAAAGSGLASAGVPEEQAASEAAGTAAPQRLPSCRTPLPMDTEAFMFTLTHLLTFNRRQVPPTAAALAAAQQAIDSAAASHALGTSLAGPEAPKATAPSACGALAAQGSIEAGPTASSSSGGRIQTVPPLWQLAALAVPVSEFGDRPLSADPDAALQAVLRPFVDGSRTPAFLAGCCSSEASAGSCSDTGNAAGAATAAAGLVACPAPPPEQRMIKLVLGNAVWLRHVACTWCGSLHRTDAAAWALHPQQEHLWAHPLNRQLLAMFLKSSMSGLLSGYRAYNPHLVRAHEQQLRRHQQVQAAGLTWGDVSSTGGGVLPHFVAGVADAATALLADAQPVAISRLVQMLGGGSSVACIEHVKGALAAVLAIAADQIKAVDATWDEGWVQVTVGAIRKASEAGDMDLMALLVLLDVQAWCIRPCESWADGGW